MGQFVKKALAVARPSVEVATCASADAMYAFEYAARSFRMVSYCVYKACLPGSKDLSNMVTATDTPWTSFKG